MRSAIRLVVALLAVLASAGSLPGAEGEAPPSPADPWSVRVDALREDLVQLRLEKVLADSDALLRETGLPEGARAETWILRSQAHVALGDLDSAARDFEEILRRRPGFEPEASLMTPEAAKRFAAVRARTVGTLRIEVVPPDAVVVVDGEPRAATGGARSVAVLAGEREVRLERPGHDLWMEAVAVEAGKEVFLQVRLVPNARTVTFVTDLAGVAIEIDGREVGRTAVAAADAATGMRANASLTVENVPLGEHQFSYVRPCYRTERRTEMLNIDILDPAPLTLTTVRMKAAFAPLAIAGEPAGARVRVDGEYVGNVPSEAMRLCPGERVVDVERDGHLLFRAEVDAADGVPVALEVRPRPNLALVGAPSMPVGFERLAEAVNVAERRPLDGDGAALATVEGWERLGLGNDIHLGLVEIPPSRPGESARRYLYSPVLRTVERLDAPPVDPGPPRWAVNVVGAVVADTRTGGPARVVAVRAGGPAATSGLRVGDRVLEVDGAAVANAAAFRRALDASAPGATLGLRVEGADGARRELPLAGSASPRIEGAARGSVAAALRAAWAHQIAFATPAESATPLANLARLLEDAGRDGDALAAWNRVRWPERDGIGPGTAAYHRGRLLLSAGREAEAVEAFREAAATRAVDRDDDGPAVGPAAADYLADLGVAVENR